MAHPMTRLLWFVGLVGVVGGGLLFLLSRKHTKKHIRALVTADRRHLTEEFKAKLSEIFSTQLDLDGDGTLSDEELDRLVFLTQGQHITADMAEFIRSHFETNDEGWLTSRGFIASYEWALQHLTDETRAEEAFAKDLNAFGFTYTCFKEAS